MVVEVSRASVGVADTLCELATWAAICELKVVNVQVIVVVPSAFWVTLRGL
jgi:hypothetical protein